MSPTTNMLRPHFTADDLARLGAGVLAYVREIEGTEAAKLLGNQMVVLPETKLYCLYSAHGAPISISPNYQAALGSAMEHELIAASVH